MVSRWLGSPTGACLWQRGGAGSGVRAPGGREGPDACENRARGEAEGRGPWSGVLRRGALNSSEPFRCGGSLPRRTDASTCCAMARRSRRRDRDRRRQLSVGGRRAVTATGAGVAWPRSLPGVAGLATPVGRSPEPGWLASSPCGLLRPKAVVGRTFSRAGLVTLIDLFSLFLLLFEKRISWKKCLCSFLLQIW
jgi:hypothetical protein